MIYILIGIIVFLVLIIVLILWHQNSENRKYIKVCYFKSAYKQYYMEAFEKSIHHYGFFCSNLIEFYKTLPEGSEKNKLESFIKRALLEENRISDEFILNKRLLQTQEYILKDKL